ncbi:hypothetical protein FGG01_00110, partial [Xylella fastidiosa subsp. multiplex]|nr:hypothetical protein [Xylella fastidiosa subsp. multiplex]
GGFKVVYEINRIIVSNSLHTDFIPPYWETNELLAAFAYKLRRLIVGKISPRICLPTFGSIIPINCIVTVRRLSPDFF